MWVQQRRMTVYRGFAVASLALALTLVGCSAPASSLSVSAAPLRGKANDAEFALVVTSPRASWSAAEAITVQAGLSYVGALPVVEFGGAAGGVIGFSVFETTGNRRMEAVRDGACFFYTMSPDQPITTPYAKSGAINPSDANEAFYRQFFSDPLFHLPAGSWRVEAWAQFYVGHDCQGRQVDLRASLLITVQ